MTQVNSRTGDNKILVVDDDRTVLNSIVKLLKSSNYRCITALTSDEGVKLIKAEKPLVVLTDLKMETETSGIDILEEAKKTDPDSVVLLYTAFGNVPIAVEAFKKGAFDFIQKVATHHDILHPVERAFKYARMQKENAILRSRLDLTDDGTFYGAIGTSPVSRDLFDKAKRVAMTNATVMITGDTGTGKEVIAKGIHYHSPRCEEPFVPVAVGALPDTLLESELFGYMRGSFTGANSDKAGLFETANRGTIFLDEIGEVSADMQHKLLRVLQERQVRRVGGHKHINLDLRVLSATNKDPEQLVKEGKLREDLYYRLNVIRIHIPLLKERREDVPVLAYHFLKKYRNTGIIKVEKINSEALLYMQQYDWPGNVRELQGVIESLAALATSPEIKAENLPEKLRPTTKRVFFPSTENLDFKSAKAKIIEDFEKQYIEGLLEKYEGNISKVADEAGLNRKTIYRLIEARKINFKRTRPDKG
ncbi:sigma-54-dependent Fis family transcriptional regulator [candidate division KSB1 bacterium]|nr:sigma-54-dependent Fis family transcriptional regulator [candidate division KSB1 bacterium]